MRHLGMSQEEAKAYFEAPSSTFDVAEGIAMPIGHPQGVSLHLWNLTHSSGYQKSQRGPIHRRSARYIGPYGCPFSFVKSHLCGIDRLVPGRHQGICEIFCKSSCPCHNTSNRLYFKHDSKAVCNCQMKEDETTRGSRGTHRLFHQLYAC
jgi:hypothetical protein